MRNLINLKIQSVLTFCALLVVCECLISHQNSQKTSGIEISYSEDSFTNIFYGISEILKHEIQNEKLDFNWKYFNINMSRIDLKEMQLDRNSSKTTFIGSNQLHVVLHFNSVRMSFAYQVKGLNNIIKVFDFGYIDDTNLTLDFNVAMKKNPKGALDFLITRFDLQAANLYVHLNNIFINFIANEVLFVTNEFLRLFRQLLNSSIQIFLDTITERMSSHLYLPHTDVVLDLSVTESPIIQNERMIIFMSGNSFIEKRKDNSTRQSETIKYFQKENKLIDDQQESSVVISEGVLQKLIQNVLVSNGYYNITFPWGASATTPINSRSLSAVLPGLRKFEKVHYPIVEILLQKMQMNMSLKDDQLFASFDLPANLYMQLPYKNIPSVKYNHNPVRFQAEIILDVLNQQNYLTILVSEFKLIDVILTPEDNDLFNILDIKILFPFFDQLIKDSINIETFQHYLDLSLVLGFQPQSIELYFENNSIRLELLF